MAQYDQTRWVGVKPTVKTAEDPGKKVVMGAASSAILAANDSRTSFIIRNTGAVDVYISFSTMATTDGFPLEPGDAIADDDYCGAVAGITDGAAGEVRAIEV